MENFLNNYDDINDIDDFKIRIINKEESYKNSKKHKSNKKKRAYKIESSESSKNNSVDYDNERVKNHKKKQNINKDFDKGRNFDYKQNEINKKLSNFLVNSYNLENQYQSTDRMNIKKNKDKKNTSLLEKDQNHKHNKTTKSKHYKNNHKSDGSDSSLEYIKNYENDGKYGDHSKNSNVVIKVRKLIEEKKKEKKSRHDKHSKYNEDELTPHSDDEVIKKCNDQPKKNDRKSKKEKNKTKENSDEEQFIEEVEDGEIDEKTNKEKKKKKKLRDIYLVEDNSCDENLVVLAEKKQTYKDLGFDYLTKFYDAKKPDIYFGSLIIKDSYYKKTAAEVLKDENKNDLVDEDKKEIEIEDINKDHISNRDCSGNDDINNVSDEIIINEIIQEVDNDENNLNIDINADELFNSTGKANKINMHAQVNKDEIDEDNIISKQNYIDDENVDDKCIKDVDEEMDQKDPNKINEVNEKPLMIRYYQLRMDVKCYNCNEIGHVSDRCPYDKVVICRTCLKSGHVEYKCPQNMKCFKCNQSGHRASECDSSLVTKCSYCGSVGHLKEDCLNVSKRIYPPFTVKCDDCGKKDHFICKFKFPILTEDYDDYLSSSSDQENEYESKNDDKKQYVNLLENKIKDNNVKTKSNVKTKANGKIK